MTIDEQQNTAINHPQQSGLSKKSWFYINVALAVTLIITGVWVLIAMSRQSSGVPEQNGSVPRPTSEHQGQIAQDFDLPTLTGKNVALSDYSGQVVLVNLWATWCPPCQAEMPAINAFYEAHKEEGFVVLAVNNQEDAITVNAFIKAKGFTFPVLLDTQARVLSLYQAHGLPTTFIIDRDGLIQHVQIGEITDRQLQTIVEPLL